MIKNYESYKPSDIARFLKTELFAIEIDKLAGMQLRDDYEHIPDILMEFCDSFRLILFCKKHFALSLLYLLFINCVTHQIPKNPPSHQNAPLSFFE